VRGSRRLKAGRGRVDLAVVSSASPGSPRKPRGTSLPGVNIIGLIGLGLVALLGLTSGLSGVLIFAGLYLLVTGAWAVVRRGSWLGKSTRRAGAGVLAGGLVLMIAGGAVADPTDDAPPAASAPDVTYEPSPAPTPTATPTPTPTEPSLEEQAAALPAPELAPGVDVQAVTSTAAPQTALATAMLLEVKGRAPKTGYDRDLFGSGWIDVDRNGCDTRNDMLSRDLEPQTFKVGTHDCVVLTGTLADPFSATTIDFVRGNATSNAVQIDHVVALSDAWQKGAQGWDEARRVGFANDPMNLLAVDGPLNMQKGDGDAATWLPPNKAFRCQYVARQVGVKYTYGLWVTEAERNAVVSILSACPDQPLPAGSTVPPVPAPAPAAEPAPAPAPAPAAPEPALVAPAPAPAPATPANPGNSKNCGDFSAWPAAQSWYETYLPFYGDVADLDGDDDGVACESLPGAP